MSAPTNENENEKVRLSSCQLRARFRDCPRSTMFRRESSLQSRGGCAPLEELDPEVLLDGKINLDD